MNKVIPILALILFLITNSNAQEYLYKNIDKENITFKAIQKSFNDWASTKKLSETKGWKWFKRWEQHYAQRANPDGSLPDVSILYQEALNYNAVKANRSNSTNWLPVGPNTLPTSPNPNSGHGMARINCVAFHPSNANIFWVGVAQGGVWKTVDNGLSWTPLDDGLPILRVSDIAVDPSNPDVIYVCLGDYEYNGVSLSLDNRKRHTHYGIGIYKTTNGGLSWSPTGHTLNQTNLDNSLLRKLIIDPNNSNNLVVGGFEGIWKSTNAGVSWTNTQANTIIGDMEQDPTNPNILYAATSYIFTLQTGTAGVLKSTDFGSTWTPLTTGIPPIDSAGRINIAIAPSDPSYIYALVIDKDRGFYGLYQSTNSGLSWTKKSTGSSPSNPNILAWYDGIGEVGGQGSYDLCLLVDPNDKNHIYTGGVNIWGSKDGGATWTASSFWSNGYGQSIHADQHQFKYNPLDDKIYVCNDGGIMRTDSIILKDWQDIYNGDTWPTVWENLSSGMQVTSFYRLGINNGRIIAGAQDNSTFYYNGLSWSNVIGGDGMECFFHPTNLSILFGSWQYGGLARSIDGGFNFSYGLGNDIKNVFGEEGEWVTPWHYSLQSSAIYAGYGNLWKSIDDGDNWTKLSTMPNMSGATFPAPASALARCSQNKNVIYMAKRIYHSYNSNSQLWATTNEGGLWTNVTAGLPDSLYFTYLAADDDNPSIAWVTCSGFTAGQKVFKTINNGTTWTNVTNNLPNLPVNCIVLDENSNDHSLYVATDLGVYYTNDNLTGWQLYGTGIPNVITSALEIDYTNQDLYVATFGRGIWKTDLSVASSITSPAISKSEMQLAPNPNNGSFTLDITAPTAFDAQMNVVDVMGRTVYSEAISISEGETIKTLGLELNSGVYFLQLLSGNQSKVLKFLRE